MTLDAIGNIGEAVGGLAVVVSLVYLAIQMRLNTASVRSATHQSIVATSATTNAVIAQDKELARIFRVGCENLASLDDDERVQFSFLVSQFIDIFENLYLHHVHGSLDDDFWRPREEAYLDLFRTPGFAHCWRERSSQYSSSFERFMNERIEESTESQTSRRLLLRDEPPRSSE